MNKREVETQKCVLYLWGENIFQTKEKSFCHWGHKFVAELLLLLLKKPLGWKWDLRTRNSHRDRTFSWWERVKIRDLSWKSLPDQKLFPIEISMAEMKSFSQECWFSPHQPLKWKSVLDKHSSIHPPLLEFNFLKSEHHHQPPLWYEFLWSFSSFCKTFIPHTPPLIHPHQVFKRNLMCEWTSLCVHYGDKLLVLKKLLDHVNE